MNLEDEFRKIFEDQRAFNLLFREPPESPAKMAEQARDFVVYTESELHELLRTLPWKKHRRMPYRTNRPHMEEEGADIFKCVLSLLQIIGIDTPEKLVEIYWRKTLVVRQRYQEEWMLKLDGPCVVVDIDNVLCNYILGMGSWMMRQPTLPAGALERIQGLVVDGEFLNARSVGITEEQWQNYKHEFRTQSMKRTLPVFPDAMPFLHWVRGLGYRIVLLTSRPIDQYPNIFTDTLVWLNNNRLPFDFIWWATEKAERVLQIEGLRDQIVFAVDDDRKFIDQFKKAGIPSFWLRRRATQFGHFEDDIVYEAKDLFEVMEKGDEADGIRRRRTSTTVKVDEGHQ